MKLTVLVFLLTLFTSKATAQSLPDFTLVTLTGDTISSASLAGRKVYINIWETWCKPCIDEIPVLNALKEKYPDIIFLAITPASGTKAKKFIKKYRFALPNICEAEGLVNQLKKSGYPTHVFVNGAGKVTFMAGGATISWTGNEPSPEEKKERFRKANYERLDKAIITYCLSNERL